MIGSSGSEKQPPISASEEAVPDSIATIEYIADITDGLSLLAQSMGLVDLSVSLRKVQMEATTCLSDERKGQDRK